MPRSMAHVSAMKLIILLIFIGSCCCEVEFSDRSRNFSIELLHYTQLETGGHVVLSPFGVWTLMTGVALGATGNSYLQLQRAFILPGNEKKLIEGYKNLTQVVLNPTTPGVTLTSSNYVFLDKQFTIYPEFRDIIQRDFGAAIKVLDFKDPNSAARTANNYIKSSGGRVSNVLTSDDFMDSRMILSNVIYFKGLWSLPFDKNETTIEPFYNENLEIIGNVNMMSQRAQFPFSNIQLLKAFVVEIPYGNDNKYSMLLLLPNPNTKIRDMYINFAKISLKDVTRILQEDVEKYGLEEVEIKIPRFKISTNVVLNKPLNDMGVYDIFDPLRASFKKVAKEELFVSAIVHKADIEVTESGTVASAVTSALFADRISTPKFQANRPFVYFIMEKSTTSVIFGGIYSKPTLY